MPDKLQARSDRATSRALSFLERNQGRDGSFIPLWFGNEGAEEEANPVYGTAQVLITLNELVEGGISVPPQLREGAASFLAKTQRRSGGWGGDGGSPESIEETAVAIEALAHNPIYSANVAKGVEWLLQQIEGDKWMSPAPIGLYFARLWYYERLYPLIFSASALGKLRSKNG